MIDIIEKLREYAQYAETRSERDTFEATIDEISRLREELAAYRARKPVVYSPDAQAMSDRVKSVEAECASLREENARLREALKPFVPETQWIDPAIPDARPIDVMVRAGELRAARAAIRKTLKPPAGMSEYCEFIGD